MPKARQNKKPVHFKDDQLAKENLPYPIVLYSKIYGTFICFKIDEQSRPTYCACSAEAIENYLILIVCVEIYKSLVLRWLSACSEANSHDRRNRLIQ